MYAVESPRVLEIKFNGELIQELTQARKGLSDKIMSLPEDVYDSKLVGALNRIYDKLVDYKDLQSYLLNMSKEEEFDRYGELAVDLKIVNQGYQILMSRKTTECGGVALGYNPDAFAKFVTWAYKDNESCGCHREIDFYWGHYHSTFELAQADFRDRQ